MATAALTPAADSGKPYVKPYGWDRTPYSRDEFRSIRDEGNLPDDIPVPEDFTFSDFLEIINPLHQIPIVGQIYRAQTGVKFHPLSRLAGGALLGGPIGVVSAAVNIAIEKITGKDIGDHIASAIFPGLYKPAEPGPAEPAMVASTDKPKRLGERLAAVVLTDDARVPVPAMIAQRPQARLGDRLAAVMLPDDAGLPAFTPVAQQPRATLGHRLAAVELPHSAPPSAPTNLAVDNVAQRLNAIAPAAGSRGTKTLDDYRARAIEGPTSAAIARAAAPAAPQAPRPAPVAAAAAPGAVTPAGQPSAPSIAELPVAARLGDAPVNTWFAERMMMGLDLYRSAKRTESKSLVDRRE